MKKIIIVFVIVLFLIAIGVVGTSIYISFKIVKPTTDSINTDLAKKFSSIVYIPDNIPGPAKTLAETSYSWEMETPQKEVTAVRFSFTPSFFKGQNEITATF